jgi:hypothetical protein
MNLTEALGYIGHPEPYDVERYLEAGLTLVQNRDNLHHRIFYKIPDPGAMTTNTDPKWDEIKAGSTGERCSCGNCRTIWPSHWPDFEEKETVTLEKGSKIYIVPEGGNYKDTMVELEVIEKEGQLFFTCLNDPFSDAFDFSLLLQGPPAYELKGLATALSKQNKPALLVKKFPEGAHVDAEQMVLITVNSASELGVVVGIGRGYVASRDPISEFPEFVPDSVS